MRISDWSSDVCSSDLDAVLPVRRGMRNFLQGSRWQVPGTNGGDAAAHLNRASNFNHAAGIYGWTSRILTAGRTPRSPSFLRVTTLQEAVHSWGRRSPTDRTRAVWRQRVSVRGDVGCAVLIKKKNNRT